MRYSRWFTGCSLVMYSLVSLAQSPSMDELVSAGGYLARAGDCVACHSAPEGKPFAGGRAMQTPIGVVYSTNITPDPDTGMGAYSFDEFEQSVRHGISRQGGTLYPAMPYPSYSRISDSDMRALYAYFLHGVEPVHQVNRPTDVPWPLSMRWPLTVWRWIYAPTVSAPVENSDNPLVNRGAYLVEGLGHCGSCHTPRGVALQEKSLSAAHADEFLSGGAPLEGWFAKSLRGDHVDGLGRWSEAQLVAFFRTGRTADSAVFGTMSDVVVNSLQYLTDNDRLAMARYLKQLAPRHEGDRALTDDGSSYRALHNAQISKRGAILYADNCMACHRSDGMGYPGVFPGLARNPLLNGSDPTSLITLVLGGATVPAVNDAVTPFTMPPFGWRLADQDVADLISFIRGSWGNQGGAVSAEGVATIRKTFIPESMGVVDHLQTNGTLAIERQSP